MTDPLAPGSAIADRDNKPTPYFMRLWQQMRTDLASLTSSGSTATTDIVGLKARATSAESRLNVAEANILDLQNRVTSIEARLAAAHIP